MEPDWEAGWEPDWEPGWKPEWEPNWNQTGTKLGPNWNQKVLLGGHWRIFGAPWEVPWGSLGGATGASLGVLGRFLGARWEEPWGTPGVPGTGPAPGTPKVPKSV